MNDLKKLQEDYDAFLRAWEMDAEDASQIVTAFDYDYGGCQDNACLDASQGFYLTSKLIDITSLTTNSLTVEWTSAYYYFFTVTDDCTCEGPYIAYMPGVFEISEDGENWTQRLAYGISPLRRVANVEGLSPNTLYHIRVTWDATSNHHLFYNFEQTTTTITTLGDSTSLSYNGSALLSMGGGEIVVGECEDYRELILGHLLKGTALSKPSTLAIALCEQTPGYHQCGWSMPEVANIGGYARQVVTEWSTVSDGEITNGSDIVFGPATSAWGFVRNFAVMDTEAYGEGSILFVGSFYREKLVQVRDKIVIPAGAITLAAR